MVSVREPKTFTHTSMANVIIMVTFPTLTIYTSLHMKWLQLLWLEVSVNRKKETIWERREMHQRDLFDPPKIWVAELDWQKVLEYCSLSNSLKSCL